MEKVIPGAATGISAENASLLNPAEDVSACLSEFRPLFDLKFPIFILACVCRGQAVEYPAC